jgi:hypothetical protein
LTIYGRRPIHGIGSYLTDLVHPASPPLPGQVVAAIREFRLEDDLLRKVQDLPYAQRRLLAIWSVP